MVLLRRFLRDQHGASAIEYCFIASIICLAIFTGLQAIGPKLNTRFTNVANGLN